MKAEPLEAIRLIADQLRASLPSGVNISDISRTSKLPTKVITLRESLIHRVSELADTALDLIDSGRLVPAAIIIRAVMETTGLIYWIHKRLESAVADGKIGDLDEFLMRALVGAKVDDGSERILALNALSSIDHVSRHDKNSEISFRDMYDLLSELTHPNWFGVMGAYSKIDQLKWSIDFGIRRDPRDTEDGGVLRFPLHYSLILFVERYNDMKRFFPEFVNICEKEVQDKSS